MGFVKKEAQIEAVDIDHNRLLLSNVCSVAAVKLKIPVFIKSLIIVRHGYVIEDVNLRRDLPIVWDEFYFAYVDDSVKLKCDLLRVCAEPASLPPLRAGKEKGGNGELFFLRTAWYDFVFQLATAHLLNSLKLIIVIYFNHQSTNTIINLWPSKTVKIYFTV